MTTVIDLKDQLEVVGITRGTREYKHKKSIDEGGVTVITLFCTG